MRTQLRMTTVKRNATTSLVDRTLILKLGRMKIPLIKMQSSKGQHKMSASYQSSNNATKSLKRKTNSDFKNESSSKLLEKFAQH